MFFDVNRDIMEWEWFVKLVKVSIVRSELLSVDLFYLTKGHKSLKSANFAIKAFDESPSSYQGLLRLILKNSRAKVFPPKIPNCYGRSIKSPSKTKIHLPPYYLAVP